MRGLRNRYFLLGDVLFLPAAVYVGFVLRLDNPELGPFVPACLLMMALTVLLTPVVFFVNGVYARYWRYAMAEEAPLFIRAVGLLTLLVSGGAFGLAALPGGPDIVIPRSIPGIFFFLALAAAVSPRLAIRLLAGDPRPRRAAGTGVLVIGAGQAGAMIVRELHRNPQLGLTVIGFVDDDPAKQGARIAGAPVLGDRRALRRLVQQHHVRRIIIAMPSAPGLVIRELVRLCQEAGVQPQTVPGLYEVLGGAVSVSQLRTVQIEDLLRRDPIQTDLAAVDAALRGKRVLITGAGGSIGGELCRQVLRCGPRELILVGHGENSIFTIHNELLQIAEAEARAAGGSPPALHAVIADVRFPDRLRAIFDRHRPEVVFHAAAHKHVPLMEANPAEAITNNVLGTRNVLDAALAAEVKRFVLISTDKAVKPASVMGASKRIAELLVHRAAQLSGKPYMVVRFGNVLGSRGSVVLTMKEQIARGGPVTVTHPEITRFFMTIPEAVQLVLQAVTLGRGGEVFVFDMGQPVKIADLAGDLIRLSGLEIGRDIDIVYTGLRPGEKLYEELFAPDESYERTAHRQIFIAANASRLVPANLPEALVALEAAASYDDRAALFGALQTLIPQFVPREEKVVALPSPAPRDPVAMIGEAPIHPDEAALRRAGYGDHAAD